MALLFLEKKKTKTECKYTVNNLLLRVNGFIDKNIKKMLPGEV